MTFCHICGEVLDEGEKDRSDSFHEPVCDDCLLDGLAALKGVKKDATKRVKDRKHDKEKHWYRYQHERRKKARERKHRRDRAKANDGSEADQDES